MLDKILGMSVYQGMKIVGDTDHEPPVENPRLLDPEEGLDGPGEAVLVPQLGHQRARHLVVVVMVMVVMVVVMVVVVMVMMIKVVMQVYSS